MDNSVEIFFWIMGGANTVALFIAAAILNSFRRTVDRLEKADTGLDARVNQLEVSVAGLKARMEQRQEDIKQILMKLDAIQKKFEEYDRNIAEFYLKYGHVLEHGRTA